MKKTVSEYLREAKGVIATPDKWTKYVTASVDGKRCSVGATSEVIFQEGSMHSMALGYSALNSALARGVPLDFEPASDFNIRVIHYNDAEWTRHQHVMAMFDRAIELAEEVEGLIKQVEAREEEEVCV